MEQCREIDTKFRLFPFIHETNNLRSWTDATKEATFPDVDLDALPVIGGSMHMGNGLQNFFKIIFARAKWNQSKCSGEGNFTIDNLFYFFLI